MSGWTGYNGLTDTMTYDTDLRPTSITVPGVESLAFTYNAANRVTAIANGVNGTQSETLGYSALGQLTSMASTADTESYQYDADGNRTQQVVNGVASTFGYAPGSNQLESVTGGLAATYGYDANGNTTSIDNHVAYTYGPFARLLSAGGTDFVLSADGQRLEKTSATGTTYFASSANGTPMAEHQSTNGLWLDYVWLNGKLVTVVTSDGGVYPVHDDQTGRPIAMTNLGNQSIIWHAQNLPFMRNVTTTTRFDFDIGFPGQYFDSESGLWHNGQRDYDATLGRYIESDPIELGGGVNTYAYVGGNPISNVDPLGLCKTCSQLKQAAAQVAEGLEHMSQESEARAGASALATALGVAGEAGFGLDTPYTVSVGAATGFFGTTAAVTGSSSAAFNTFASSGNPQFVASFAFRALISSGVRAAATASDIPFASRFADNLGQLAGQAVGLSAAAQVACQAQ